MCVTGFISLCSYFSQIYSPFSFVIDSVISDFYLNKVWTLKKGNTLSDLVV